MKCVQFIIFETKRLKITHSISAVNDALHKMAETHSFLPTLKISEDLYAL